MGVSIAFVIKHTYLPHIVILGRTPQGKFRDVTGKIKMVVALSLYYYGVCYLVFFALLFTCGLHYPVSSLPRCQASAEHRSC
jgi:hypothetical protein